ncbi:DNA-3-methyladenine glycosylase family protein [Aporhodopirellula aestuarii]|uniref:DNA-3-methyladenine glycosylase II n=1 Tax=Aporhodopirellula aestuarii TaxID=2950107 RepID=A0ABT0U3Q2_9BACT|nr:DNA-3-methyladenine glycosylase 2 family protein [Aporhodopirellula aestuarii]MCM2371540.1 DNA-3-methyladenine glycosylase 2 family protein [Aporhodopirellula aestuarii]
MSLRSNHPVHSPLDDLCRRDGQLKLVRERVGEPLAWTRPATFATFTRIILEQQVSLASAKVTFDRLRSACGGVINAKRILTLSDEDLRRCGLSRQKARYVSLLANDVRQRKFSIAALASMDDHEVRQSITERMGLGNWTADIYLLMALRRDDILPIGDLALVKGIQELDPSVGPSVDAICERAEVWRPYRSMATKMIWTLYLFNRNRSTAIVS